MNHILIEYKDGSFQWIENTTEEKVLKIKELKRISSYSQGKFYFSTKKWKTGEKSQFQKIYLD